MYIESLKPTTAADDDVDVPDTDTAHASSSSSSPDTKRETTLNNLIPTDSSCSFVRLSVTEGKYRMVRRMLHNSGHSVISLRRIAYGEITLGDLPENGLRPCTAAESSWSRELPKRGKR